MYSVVLYSKQNICFHQAQRWVLTLTILRTAILTQTKLLICDHIFGVDSPVLACLVHAKLTVGALEIAPSERKATVPGKETVNNRTFLSWWHG